jgi:hypothetical protein
MKILHFFLIVQAFTFVALQADDSSYGYEQNTEDSNNQGQGQNQNQNRSRPTDDYDASRGQMDPGMKPDSQYYYPDYTHNNYYHYNDR